MDSSHCIDYGLQTSQNIYVSEFSTSEDTQLPSISITSKDDAPVKFENSAGQCSATPDYGSYQPTISEQHVKKKSYLFQYPALEMDGNPNDPQGECSQENNGEMELEEHESEDHDADENMETGENVASQNHSSTPKKEFPSTTHPVILTRDYSFGSVSSGDSQNLRHSTQVKYFPVVRGHEESEHHAYGSRLSPQRHRGREHHRRRNHSAEVRRSSPDMRDARKRLKTFDDFWPSRSQFTNTTLLASCGFYAIGQDDAVKCFNCKTVIANWERDDDPKQRHLAISPNCRFARGENCGNRELSPVQKSKRNPAGTQKRDRRYGRYPRETRPRNRRASHSSPPDVHRSVSNSSHSEHSRGSRHAPRSNPPLPLEYANPTPEQIRRQNLLEQFPCANPANPSMREESARLRTYRDLDFRRNTRLRATNETLASAGLYYEGTGDNTKCWYCGGGLKHYQPNDDPWEEHAKYFPECEYLLQQRGPAWISDVSARYPNITRPVFTGFQNLNLQNQTPAAPPQMQFPPLQPTPLVTTPLQRNLTQHQPPQQSVAPQQPWSSEHLPPLSPTSPLVGQQLFQPTPLLRPQAPTRQSPPAVQPPPPPAQQPPPSPAQRPPPPPPQASRNVLPPANAMIEDPQAMLNAREEMVAASMHSEPVEVARNMGFVEDQIRTAQMRRVIALGGPYQTSELLIEAMLHPETDPRTLEAPPQQQLRQPQRNISMRNGQINIRGGNFSQTIFGVGRGRRGRSNIIIDGRPLEEYIAEMQRENDPPPPPPAQGYNIPSPVPAPAPVRPTEQPVPEPSGFNTPGTRLSAGTTNTPPTQATSPMTQSTSTTNSNNVPSTSGGDTRSAEERLEALQKEYQCKICYSAPVQVLFEPCGHVCACLDCGSRVNHCPMCRKRITRYIKTYHC